MSRPGDDGIGMPTTHLLDDDTIDALILGDDLDPWLHDLATFAADVRACADRPPSRPSAALAAVMAAGPSARVTTAAGRGAGADGGDALAAARSAWHPARLARVAGLGLALKIGLGASTAAAGVAGAGAAGMLPGDTARPIRHALEAVTPFRFGTVSDDLVTTDRTTDAPSDEDRGSDLDLTGAPAREYGSAAGGNGTGERAARGDEASGTRDASSRSPEHRDDTDRGTGDDDDEDSRDRGGPARSDRRPGDQGGSSGGRPGTSSVEPGGDERDRDRHGTNRPQADGGDQHPRDDRVRPHPGGRGQHVVDQEPDRSGVAGPRDAGDAPGRDRRHGDGWREPTGPRADRRHP